MNNTEKGFKKELIDAFSYKTGCSLQFGGCPCNSCFHNIDADFKHICWIILLYLRGDYKDYDEGIKSIREELGLK